MPEKMTSRQRVVAALNHQEPDRVPIDIGGLILAASWHELAQDRVKAYLGYTGGETVTTTLFAHTVEPDPRIRDRFQVDCIGLASRPPASYELELHSDEEGGTWFSDEWGQVRRQPPEGYYYDLIRSPLAGATVADVARYRWPDPTDSSRLAGLKEQAREIYENTGYCLVYSPAFNTGVFQAAATLQGYEEHYTNILANPSVSKAIMEGLTEFHIAQWNAILDELGEYIQVGAMSDDLGFQDRPILRMSLFRELLKPYYKRIVDAIKARQPDFKLVFHCDGAIRPLLPDFIEIGVDAINPVQVSCAGMGDTAALKRDFGDRLSFWGAGVDTQSTLPFGTPDDVRAEVRRRIRDLGPGGGYVFTPVHCVQPEVPPANVVACYDAALEFGEYPIEYDAEASHA